MHEQSDLLVLASASPRRSQILQRMGLPHRVFWREIDETAGLDWLAPGRTPAILARRKVEAVVNQTEVEGCRWFLGADTVIVFKNRIIGKPASAEDAAGFLHEFSGRWHSVVTGVCLYDRETGVWLSSTESTRVLFARLSRRDIDWYVSSGEWRGAAGGYRIQERGECLIERIAGNHSTVMGLPIRMIYGMLRTQNHPL